MNRSASEDLVKVIELDGEECLFYKSFPINVALLRGTTADEEGNVTMEYDKARLSQPGWVVYHNVSSVGFALCEADARGSSTVFSRILSV